MPLFRKPRPPEQKDSRAARLIALTTGGRPQWTPRDYAALASEGFARNPVAYRCVRMIAEGGATPEQRIAWAFRRVTCRQPSPSLPSRASLMARIMMSPWDWALAGPASRFTATTTR